jgi:trigger factor
MAPSYFYKMINTFLTGGDYIRLLTRPSHALIISSSGEVLELADRHDLGSCVETREGSSPSFPTLSYAKEANLKIETTPRDDHQVKMVVHIETDQFEKSMHQAARKIATRIKIPGFRPGKAPYDMIIRNVGEDGVKSEAIDLLIDEVYPAALKESNLNPGAMGKIEKVSEETPPVIEFLVPLAPEVTLGDYHSLRKEYKAPVVEQKEVDEFIDRLRMNYATSEPVEREVQRGDIVYLTLSGNLVNPAEGEESSLLKEGSYPVLVPEKTANENDWPFPGFAESLIGKTVGSEDSAKYQYPDDSNLDNLRGKHVEFKYRLESVKKLILPDLDEAFIQMLGEKKSVDEFVKSVKDNLELRNKNDYERDYSNDLVAEICKSATVKYPPQLVDDEIEELIKSLEHDLSHQKMDLATYLKTRNLEKEAFIESEVKPAAIKRLEHSLVMDEFTRIEDIKLDMTKWDEAVNDTARNLSYSSDINQLRKNMSRDQLSQAVTYETANRLMNQQIFDRMKDIATGNYKKPVGDNPTEEKKSEKVTGSRKSTKPKVKPETQKED